MRLSLYEFETGVETIGGDRVVYDIANAMENGAERVKILDHRT